MLFGILIAIIVAIVTTLTTIAVLVEMGVIVVIPP
jgi:hypothetical protein